MNLLPSNAQRLRPLWVAASIALPVAAHFLPAATGWTSDAQTAAGVAAMTLLLWTSRALPLALAPLLGLAFLAAFGTLPADRALSLLADPAPLFFLGALTLGAAAQGSGLLTRIVLAFVIPHAETPAKLFRALFLAGAGLSLFLPGEVAAAALLPPTAAAADALELRPKQGRVTLHLFFAPAWGVAVGSLVTPMGGALAPLALSLLARESGQGPLSFALYSAAALPLALLAGVLALILLTRLFRPEISSAREAAHRFDAGLGEMGALTTPGKVTGFVLVAAALAAMIFGFGAWPGVIALFAMAALVALRGREWSEFAEDQNLSVLPLVGGSLALGLALRETGAAGIVAAWFLERLPAEGLPLLTGAAAFLLALRVGGFASSTLLLPLALAFAEGASLSPFALALSTVLPAGAAAPFSAAAAPGAIAWATGYFRRRDLVLPAFLFFACLLLLVALAARWYWPLVAGLG